MIRLEWGVCECGVAQRVYEVYSTHILLRAGYERHGSVELIVGDIERSGRYNHVDDLGCGVMCA